MPEYHLDYGSPEGARTFQSLSSLAQGYVQALFFTADQQATCPGQEDSDNPKTEDLSAASVAELSAEAIEMVTGYCRYFESQCGERLLPFACEQMEVAGRAGDFSEALQEIGRNLFYVSNGHGVGFTDREWWNSETAEQLDRIARRIRTVDLYRGDDEQLYLG